MGCNSSILIFNDHLSDIEEDLNFGKKVAAAVSRLSIDNNVPIHPGGLAVESHHAERYSVVIFGGNTASCAGTVYCPSRRGNESGDISILRALADKLGYQLRKKPAKRRKNDES